MIDRFAHDLAATGFADGRLGLAVSGGPDSVALLLLAHAALPGRIAVATVDHGLRAEAADEAAFVARLCTERGVPHSILTVAVGGRDGPQGNARAARYAALATWAKADGLTAVATGHHADDQAETVLLRLARGAGLAGLSGVRRVRSTDGVPVVRPLIGWRRAALKTVVTDAGIVPVDDPSNRDARYDRTRARALLADTPWLDGTRIAASAHHLADAEAALQWTADRLAADRIAHRWSEEAGDHCVLDVRGVPRELRRRLMQAAITLLCERSGHEGGGFACTGPELARFIDGLGAGETRTVAGLIGTGGDESWHLRVAPPRRSG